ncbi:DUF4839 domain-containing protein [Terrisporobacter sp.]|uniref:DUF4839 domain-containing protein n=1 Tax=Terrisporobacter sp. TaxID=1965305 RepID=UPI00260B593D|nr:DUF4839 domain-containing protein [Terrisporobacter sp.]
MNTIISLIVCGVLAGLMIGCSSEEVKTSQEVPEKVEETIKEEKEVVEEPIEEKILTIEDKDFKNYMTTSLPDEEYEKYFNSIQGREIEFDGSIDIIQLREGYNTRYELLVTYGDYSETNITGPYMKVKDIAYGDERGLEYGITDNGTNVKVKAKIVEFDMDRCYLVINPIRIESR